MAGVNKAIVLGHLGRDPEIRYQQNGAAIATLNIATSETFKDKEGNKQERTEWHRVTLFGRLAEIAGEYLRKGSMAYVEGRLQTRKWTDKEGQERYTTEIVGDRLQLVGGKSDRGESCDDRPARSNGNQNRNGGNGTPSGPAQSRSGSAGPAQDPFVGGNDDIYDDDIPF